MEIENFKREMRISWWTRRIGLLIAAIGTIGFLFTGPSWSLWVLMVFWGAYLVGLGRFDAMAQLYGFYHGELIKRLPIKTDGSWPD
jgi:hypothetical protein